MNKSGEIDVFEAARYFSGYSENSSFSQKILREERSLRGERISSMENQMEEKIKYKQPISPGRRLASFLNSLLNQSSLKKKKKLKPSSTMAIKEEEEIPEEPEKRRSSISHFRSFITMDYNSIYSSSSSGVRTPPPYVHTPIKTLKDFKTQKYKSAMAINDGFDKYPLEEKEFGKVDDDNGEQSDSSSDLFELQIYEFHSSDLPVYESTSMERIKR